MSRVGGNHVDRPWLCVVNRNEKGKEQRSDLCPKGMAENDIKLTVIGDHNAINAKFQSLFRILNSPIMSQFFDTPNIASKRHEDRMFLLGDFHD